VAPSDPLKHFLLHGEAEGRYPTELSERAARTAKRITASGLVQTTWYTERYPEFLVSGLDPVGHFVAQGAAEGKDPNKWFDVLFYREQHPNALSKDVNPVIHYLDSLARGELPRTHPKFDPAWYRSSNPDVAASGIDPLLHFLLWGEAEGRYGSSEDADEVRKRRVQLLGTDCRLSGDTVIAVWAWQASEQELTRCLRSVEAAVAGLTERVRVLVVGAINPTCAAFMATHVSVHVISCSDQDCLPSGEQLLAAAFDWTPQDRAAARYYVHADARGAFHPTCIVHLIKMATAAHDMTVVDAVHFPREHPKGYDPIDFATAWTSSACFLLPRSAYSTLRELGEGPTGVVGAIELSWEARAQGLMTRTCPAAIYFYPPTKSLRETQIPFS
jgi:hypothetical protein